MAHVETIEEDGAPPGVPIGRRVVVTKPSRSNWSGVLSLVPGLAYLILVYVIGVWILADPYKVVEFSIPKLGTWKISWVTFILGVAIVVVALELRKLSQPGLNQIAEVAAIGFFFVLQVVLVTVAFTTDALPIFKTTESILLAIGNGFQAVCAYSINSNSLIRTFAPASVTD